MEEGGPFRGGQKPEQIIEFWDDHGNSQGVVERTCVKKMNKWLQERAGIIDIILRQVASDTSGKFRSLLVWYREKE